jgi:F-type H+-transporting ATPase subunit epsilon
MAVALPSKIRLEIVTPARLLISEDVEEVTIPGSEGYLGVLPGHLPLLTTLGVGVLSYKASGRKYEMAVSGGFAEVLGDRVIVLAETVERPDEIDVERAREAKQKAEKLLMSKEQIDVEAAMASLLKATTRLKVAESSRTS